MPIEDVQYLIKHSVQDSALLFVDSGRRDREHYPTPSHYVVDFEEPLRNVFGMDILDATVPGTMYNVDLYNNEFILMVSDCDKSSVSQIARFNARESLGNEASSAQEISDAEEAAERDALQADLYTLGHTVTLRRILELMGVRGSAFVKANLVVLAESTFVAHPPSQTVPVTNGVPADKAAQHYAAVKYTIAAVPLTKPRGSKAMSEPGAFEYGNMVYAIAEPSSPLNASLCVWVSMFRGAFTLVPSSVPWQASAFAGASRQSDLYDFVYYRFYEITQADHEAYAAAHGSTLNLLYALTFTKVALEVGNYTAATLLLQLQNKVQAACNIDVTTTSSSTIEKQSRIRLLTQASRRFALVSSHSSAKTVLGFDLSPDPRHAEERKSVAARWYNPVAFAPSTGMTAWHMSVLRFDPETLRTDQILESPGIVNLLGIRYITLRCKEFEEHLGTTGKYGKYSTGIGIFKLASVNEIAQLRFDFVSLVRKPFHPIGRLNRLTLRFEISDGTLYDFKGVNHQILLTIKYYAPQRQGDFVDRVLNPEYDPDFAAYVANQQKALLLMSSSPSPSSSSSHQLDFFTGSGSEEEEEETEKAEDQDEEEDQDHDQDQDQDQDHETDKD